MPAAIAVPAIASVIAGGAAAGATVYGSRQAGKSAKRAQQYQSQADAEAMALERQRDEEARRQWEAQQQFEAQKWQAMEEERLYNRRLLEEREARRAPYRQASQAALGRLGDILGLPMPAPASTPMPAPQSTSAPMGPGPFRPPPPARPGGYDGSGMTPNGSGAWGVPGERMAATETNFAPVNAPGTIGALIKRPRRVMAPRY